MTPVEQGIGSVRTALVDRLRDASDRLVAVIEALDDDRWRRVPDPRVWSVGREAEHVAEAAAYHHDHHDGHGATIVEKLRASE